VSDRVILVTGASAGIGRAVADRLAGHGWTVVGASRRGAGGPGWTPVVMDVDDDRSVGDTVAAVLDRHGHIDAVVAGAGWGLSGAAEVTPLPEARAQLETNLWGAVRLVQATLPGMRERGRGHVVLISSLGGIVGLPFQAFYSASKFALEGYAEALAPEVAPFGIRVTLVEPGNVRTEFTARRRHHGGDVASDPYAARARRAVDVMARDERDGLTPDVVAAAVERVLAAERPPLRVPVGKLPERAAVLARRLLPQRWFARLTRRGLGLD
jgi:NAD(P)-dependent dehydrogenase (short-subunit alcohol dehydrogenase family)